MVTEHHPVCGPLKRLCHSTKPFIPRFQILLSYCTGRAIPGCSMGWCVKQKGNCCGNLYTLTLNSEYYGCTLIGRNRICSVSSLAKYRLMLFKMAGTLFLNNRFVLVTTSCTLAEIHKVMQT